ncbi:MAG TPA: PhzF family phenazine biosynthesis protein [Sedimentisphaerales bacterium]|mgnify:CR=1 FL=1|nr:PhzF family phenazine biosynthesis protein [Sedimentisphaerales bacterium]HRS10799.1 PhzF family phenazine biosynthesis protein [Sedimentisphaerales bacterium]HRV47505.1 PhzF family phenazine biosynthesis protein [Sedimentisphaerales bacterium]
MKPLTFYLVDVFAERKYAGNPLAVFRDADELTSGEMQQIAREMNFSETTFVLSDEPRDGGYDVRIFTPVAEVPFAGHPTLGTAYVIRQEITGNAVEQVNLNLKLRQIPVTFGREEDRSILWMKQKSPDFGDTSDPAPMAALLGLSAEQIDARVEQGYEIDRPSLVRLSAEQRQNAIDVNVGGNVVMVAKGQWL